jgi:hypothetical protein
MPAVDARGVRYVCLVCFAAAATEPAICMRDGSPLLPVDAPETVTALRARVARGAARRETVRLALAMAIGASLALAVCLALEWPILPRASGGIYSSVFAWMALSAAVLVGAASFALVPPQRSDGETAALLARLGLDWPRDVRPLSGSRGQP